MEDMRKLLEDQEAAIAPESLGYVVRGLTATFHALIQDAPSSDAPERMRQREMVHAVSFCAQLTSTMLARWLGEHVDHCAAKPRKE